MTRRDLPAPPAWAVPIETARPKSGESVLAIAARERAARVTANTTITEFRGWYQDVRTDYAGEKK